ncbi:diacylglycerol kinase family protein [Paenibacillus yanchengensis]
MQWAFSGLCWAIRKERHLRIHLIMAVAVMAAAAWFNFSRIEWLILLLMIALVIGAELINTAIERVVDLIVLSQHPVAKVAKDVAAGAVLFFAFVSIVIGIILFLPYLIR